MIQNSNFFKLVDLVKLVAPPQIGIPLPPHSLQTIFSKNREMNLVVLKNVQV